MSNRSKTVVIEKDGVQAEATQITLEGLVRNGWTVVETGDKGAEQAATEQQKTEDHVESQVQAAFGEKE